MAVSLSDVVWIAVSLILCSIAIKLAVVAGSLLYETIAAIALAVSLLFRVLCIAIVVWIAQMVWTNRLDLMERLRHWMYIGMRKIETNWTGHEGNNVSKISRMSSLSASQADIDGLDPEERDARVCVICQDNVRTIVCLPCRHFILCEDCSKLLANGNVAPGKLCPMCRKPIRELIKVYL
ncbi:uncharacterized protein LOC129595869 [Paramacrobiotus metropolitanus]|uniref:uncharacterized protein LOC129595869 n=1 Tax=Paramacrobiotus metropolitanus TaxID=2943436 RepID=UPI002446182C|nr:uncharacterized protein LOC129595869 [Paramacrobiotus metropolitanus]